MITWKIAPVYYAPKRMAIQHTPCIVCSQPMLIPLEVLALMCSEGGAEWSKLKGEVLFPVHVCSELCGEAWILGRM